MGDHYDIGYIEVRVSFMTPLHYTFMTAYT